MAEAEKRTINRRKTRRKPLADCTNTITTTVSSHSSSSTIVKLPKASISSAVKSSFHRIDNSRTENPSSVPLPLASTPLRPPTSSSISGTVEGNVLEPCTVYRRRQSADKRKSKGKEIDVPLTHSPLERVVSVGNKINEDADIDLPKVSAVPSKKKRRHTLPKKGICQNASLKDFIEQQRAYFADIDAFELPEEEVASVEELE